MAPNAILPTDQTTEQYPAPTPRQVLRVALNLKYLIDHVISIGVPAELITQQGLRILNDNVIQLTLEACGGQGDGKKGSLSRRYRLCIVFCLLKVCSWYWDLAVAELHDSELHFLRALAAQQLAKLVIEREEDERYCFVQMLCRRYLICLNDEDAQPANALELAVDMHLTIVIGLLGYQRCMKWLWRGWIVQLDNDPHAYTLYRNTADLRFLVHFDPDRIKTPLYQNFMEIFFCVVVLVLYTYVVNLRYDVHGLDFGEGLLYAFFLSLIMDEVVKFYHVGWLYFGFWNAFNDTLYVIVAILVVFRVLSLAESGRPQAEAYGEILYRVLSCALPFVYGRLLLYLDAERFVGAMIVVVKRMLKELLIFFSLLIVVMIGFLQGFLGLDLSDGKRESTKTVLKVMVMTVVGGPDFDALSHLALPYATIIYYLYTFLVTTILLNVLVALFSLAYSIIYDNATDEYLALVAQKTLKYIRAPDENVFVPPFNLVELTIEVLCGWWTSRLVFQAINYYAMLVVYSPVLLFVSIQEVRALHRVQYNRMKRVPDDSNEVDTEWSLTDGYVELLLSGEDGIAATQQTVREGIRAQRAAEREDPEFSVNLLEWHARIHAAAPAVEKAAKTNVGWELYPLYEKLESLEKLVGGLMEENRRLRADKGDSGPEPAL